MRSPRLGLLLGIDPPTPLLALCREVGTWVPIGDGRDGVYDVVLWRPGDPSGPGRQPYVLWADDAATVERHAAGALLTVTTDPAAADRAEADGRRWRYAPTRPDPAPDAVPVLPFVRQRIRAVRGLPATAVVEQAAGWSWAGRPLDDVAGDLPTALGLGSAVVTVDRTAAVQALAWGAPLVTSVDTARAVDAIVDEECLVGSSAAERRALARGLAADLHRAAALSWRGRLRYERRHALRSCTEAVLAAIGDRGSWAPSSLGSRLGELGTPASARVVGRATAFVAPFVSLPLQSGDLA